MKKFRILLPVLLAVAIILPFTGLVPQAKAPSREEVMLRILSSQLASAHYQPRAYDDAFSEQLFTLYLDRLDPGKRFFLKEDVDALKTHFHTLDDEIAKGPIEFFDKAAALFLRRLGECETLSREILAKPFDFEKEESLETDPDKTVYAAGVAEMKEQWRKYLKYQTLQRIGDLLDEQEKAKEGPAKSAADLEKEAREGVAKSTDAMLKRLAKTNERYRFTAYLNAICGIFDPHTEFLPPDDKENFDITMSGQFEGIGARLQEKDGTIKVQDIIPGSASWRQGSLKGGDAILKVAQGAEAPVDVTDMILADAVKLIRGKKGTEVRLTVRKVDGSVVVIPITRDKVVMEETYAQSAVVKQGAKSIGYIRLPAFYADFAKTSGRNCSEDVRKEIEKLKADGVEGIVLDLRDNGGGSLQDVVTMAGLFIESGPIVQVKQRSGRAQSMSDRDPGVVYEGPLAVMVNKHSASASEIMAAAIQDYGRGVVVGSVSTFGKGTVQHFIALDDALKPPNDALKPVGSLKLTSQKFFRVNGGSTQLKGVASDIVLPDIIRYLDFGEKEMEHPMPWDQIAAAKYKPWNKKWDAADLRKKSEERVKADEYFRLVDAEAKRLKEERDRSAVSLKLTDERERRKRQQEAAKKLEDLQTDVAGMEIANPTADREAIKADEAKTARNTDWFKKLRKDHHLAETLRIVADMGK